MIGNPFVSGHTAVASLIFALLTDPCGSRNPRYTPKSMCKDSTFPHIILLLQLRDTEYSLRNVESVELIASPAEFIPSSALGLVAAMWCRLELRSFSLPDRNQAGERQGPSLYQVDPREMLTWSLTLSNMYRRYIHLANGLEYWIEKCTEQKYNLYQFFTDLTKAFDSVSRNGL